MFCHYKFLLYIGIIIFELWISIAHANTNLISLDLKHVSIHEALQLILENQRDNIMISPTIKGNTSVHLHNMKLDKALDMFLVTHNLYKWKDNKILFIGTEEDYVHHKELTKKMKSLESDTSPMGVHIWQIKYAKALDIAHLLQEPKSSLVTQRGFVSVDVRTNKICVHDVETNMKIISEFIRALDVPVRQVLIEAHLASIDSDYQRNIGIQFFVNRQERDKDDKSSSNGLTNARFSFTILNLPDGNSLDMQLAALEQAGHGELISSPSLYTANQQMAVIEAGEEIPYQESSRNGATSVTFKKAVLSLKVTPQIMPNNQVLLQLEVNQDKPSKRLVLGVPAINTRHISTNIQIKHGQTVVLGGIYEMNHEHDEERIPFLAQIPLIGRLFKQQHTIRNKRELFIFVTPRIIN